ncbi:histone [Haloarcula japonica]|uniref:histone n=1 Tax=Haloarcula japonica TaxID=29282 RepID=UPI0039F731CD
MADDYSTIADDHEFSKSKIHQFLKEAGDMRVGDDAVEELRDELEEFAEKRGSQGVDHASSEGRKTVRREDIRATRR